MSKPSSPTQFPEKRRHLGGAINLAAASVLQTCHTLVADSDDLPDGDPS